MATYKTKTERPHSEPPDAACVPDYMRALPQWVLWRYDWSEERGEWAKVPYNAKTGGKAQSNNPDTWCECERAASAYNRHCTEFDGIGFVFSKDDDLCGIDFDSCVTVEEGEFKLTGRVRDYVASFESYTELSPSGTGLHMIVRANLPKGGKKNGVEIYDWGRYFTFTGRSWHDSPLPVEQRQGEVDKLWKAVFDEQKPVRISAQSAYELLQIAFKAANGARIKRLFDGDTSDFGGDDSSADLALCSLLAFYSGGDGHRLDSMFRASRLMRPKWDVKHYGDGRTYGEETINKALSSCVEFYGQQAGGSKLVQPFVLPDLSTAIRRVSDFSNDLEELYKTGFRAGAQTGWECLREIYTVKAGQWTVITGSPASGKSCWLNALMVNLAIKHNWHFAICSPEFWPVSVHIAELMALYTGQPFVSGPTPKMSVETAREAAEWVDEHFRFIEPVENSLTMPYVLNVASEIHSAWPINGLVLDPWTEFEQERTSGETETEYIKRSLSDFIRFVRLQMIHGWIVAHPRTMRRDSSGKFPIPTLYDISSSSHWYNKAHMGICLHRTDGTNKVELHVQKVKFRWCGRPDKVELFYDKATGRYSEAPVYYDDDERPF